MAGVRVRMPDGAIVELPENPTPEQIADIEASMHPTTADTAPGRRDTTPTGLFLEALKGGGRGALGTARVVGKGMTEGLKDLKGIDGQPALPAPDPSLQRLNQQADQYLAPEANASGAEWAAGKAGEFGGGMLFGPGPGSNPTLARGLVLPNSYALPPGVLQGGVEQPSIFSPVVRAAGRYAAGKGLQAMGVPYSQSVARALAQMMASRGAGNGAAVALPTRPMLEEASKRLLAMGTLGSLFADEKADEPQP